MSQHPLKIIKHKSFGEQMSVEQLDPPTTDKNNDPDTTYFRSLVFAYKPIISKGVFGGHTMAQACYAASKTVPFGYVCHNLHGYFLLPGRIDSPFYYKIIVIRNGYNYISRQVYVYQLPEGVSYNDFDFNKKYIHYICILSFKRPSTDEKNISHQHDLHDHFSVSQAKHFISNLPPAPDIDIPTWIKLANQPDYGIEEEAHSIELRKFDNSSYNANKPVSERSQIHYLRHRPDIAIDSLRKDGKIDHNLHVAALIYISDRNSLPTIVNLHDDNYALRQVASIDHSFVLHKPDVRVDVDWLVMETFSSAAKDHRGLFQGRIYDHDNELVASFMQDGILKTAGLDKLPKEKERYEWLIENTKKAQDEERKKESKI